MSNLGRSRRLFEGITSLEKQSISFKYSNKVKCNMSLAVSNLFFISDQLFVICLRQYESCGVNRMVPIVMITVFRM